MAKQKRKALAEETIRTIRRVTRKKYTADDKIRIVLEGWRGDSDIRELCRRQRFATNLYYLPLECAISGRRGSELATRNVAPRIDFGWQPSSPPVSE
jgi:transposase-like protein